MTAPEIKRDEQLNIEELERDGVTWVNVENPTDADTEYLGERFGFHHLDLDDCLSRIQRPKIDVYQKYLFIVLHFPAYRKELRITTASQVAIFVGPDYLVTLHNGDLKPLTKFFRECQIDEESLAENFSQGAAYIVYRFNLQKYAIIIATAVGGTGVIIYTLLVLFDNTLAIRLLENPVKLAIETSFWWLLFFLVVAGLGIVTQIRANRSFEAEAYNRLSEVS